MRLPGALWPNILEDTIAGKPATTAPCKNSRRVFMVTSFRPSPREFRRGCADTKSDSCNLLSCARAQCRTPARHRHAKSKPAEANAQPDRKDVQPASDHRASPDP